MRGFSRPGLGVVIACLAGFVVGCGADKSPDLPAEQLDTMGAQKSSAVQDAINKSKSEGRPAPGTKSP
jgi:hypothetical protein